jgi:hypothetical protein
VYQTPVSPPKEQDVPSLVLSIVSVVLAGVAWILQFHVIAAIPSIICGIIALVRIRKRPKTDEGMISMVLSILGIVGSALDIIIVGGAILLYVAFVVIMLVVAGAASYPQM